MKRYLIPLIITLLLVSSCFIGAGNTLSTSTKVVNDISNSIKHLENRVTIYYATIVIEYSKHKTGPYIVYGKHIHFSSTGTYHSYDADLEELVLEIVVNYTAEMNYTAGFPYILFAPIIAFGMKIENYSDYEWYSFKLKHDGYVKREGNISVEISFDMNNIESGDKFILEPKIAVVGDPQVYKSKDLQFRKFTSLLLRFTYHIPLLNKVLLQKWILPFIAEHDYSGIHGGFTKIYIFFE